MTRLLTRIKHAGVPPRIAMMMEGKSENHLDVNMLRSVMGMMMGK